MTSDFLPWTTGLAYGMTLAPLLFVAVLAAFIAQIGVSLIVSGTVESAVVGAALIALGATGAAGGLGGIVYKLAVDISQLGEHGLD